MIPVMNIDGDQIGRITNCTVNLETGKMDVSMEIDVVSHIDKLKTTNIEGFQLGFSYRQATRQEGTPHES